MATLWIFNSTSDSGHKPAIGGQLASLSENTLCLRNPWVTDSVFMGKLYCAITVISLIGFYPQILPIILDLYNESIALMIIFLIFPFAFTPFLAYRIFFIKGLSTICLNRSTQKIYYQRLSKVFVFEWSNTGGGLFKRTESGGSSFSTSYALAFAPRRADGSLHQKDCLWVDSNEPTEPDVKHVAEVWEYLRHFMAHGPDKLPPPGEPNWWHKPLHAICLTPAEAWRHYAPWRTGEPGEMQGKKNWQLPFWAVLFPYNLTVAICWYFICKLFNVRAAPPPPEAFEELPARASKRRRA
ncbi:hypothetical protein QVM55_24495 [Pseudomonas monteilii]|uniref:DUF6708 domain-containing protein n=1 Tax=Pseudomonas TaxID=286 RepID=UPI000EFB28D3|nr:MULTISPECIES: DUF6708 domain-containing protein [Pseudomonas]AYN99804.1 hypothetical protein D8767_12875 [Pseudomonas sp. LTGT-11-2Z]MBA6101989.1 hypothetical protein [Pseudomonas monteilii]MCT8188081.1 hypothetical protein [Pseudomonas monteilii]WJN85902.1 hypothetical protein LU680_16650 [Pseudomonas monteilii]WJO30489.1 hypothetical protein LU690_15265 [Pseudomonas monteilii]